MNIHYTLIREENTHVKKHQVIYTLPLKSELSVLSQCLDIC